MSDSILYEWKLVRNTSETPEYLKGFGRMARARKKAVVYSAVAASIGANIIGICLIIAMIAAVVVGFYMGQQRSLVATYGHEANLFTIMEFAVVFVASIVSTINYRSNVKLTQDYLDNTDANSHEWYFLMRERMVEHVSMGINVVLFLGALVAIIKPIFHLLFIMGIYFSFCMNNWVQARWATRMSASANLNKYVIPRTLHLIHWLKAENGPATIGYAIIVVFLTLVSNNKGWIGNEDLVKIFDGTIKVFAAGVAGYHLVLSTAAYLVGHRVSLGTFVEKHPEFISDSSALKEHLNEGETSGLVIFLLTAFTLAVAILASAWSR